MNSYCIKTAVAAAALAFLCAGPAASAEATPAKTVAKHKAKVKAKARPRAKAPAMAAEVAPVAAVPVAAVPAATVAAAAVDAPAGYNPSRPAGNPYLAYQAPVAPVNPWPNASTVASNFKAALPSLPEGQSFLPSIKRVYPTGEKPLVVVTFKCPTELVGVNTPSTKGLHELVNLAMGGINATNLLAFNLQQVCQ